MQPNTHWSAHDTSTAKEGNNSYILGILPLGIAQARQAVWRLIIGYVLVNFSYDSVRQLAKYWRALVRRVFYIIVS